MSKYTYAKMKTNYQELWDTMVIRNSWHKRIDKAARKIIANKHRYKAIENETGIPWYFQGIIHNRESSLNFSRHMHNGDSLKRRTRRVPKGRPKGTPPFTFEESTVDAFKMKKFHLVKDWSPEHIAYMSERYNGWGYQRRSHLSPYLWSGSNHYRRGKYVADGKYSSRAVDQQIGVMPLLKRIFELDAEFADVPAPELKSVSRKLRFINKAKAFIKWLGGAVTSLFGADWFFDLGNNWDQVETLLRNNMFLIVGGVALAGLFVFNYLEDKSIEDYKEGRYVPSGMAE